MQKIIEIKGGVARKPEWRLKSPIDFTLLDGEHIAIVGYNASGKSMLVDMIIGRHPLLGQCSKYDFAPSAKELISDNIKYITFRDSYGDKDGNYFLQQRWNSQEIDEDTPTVGSELDKAYALSGEDTKQHRLLKQQLYDMFDIRHLLDKYIILLSSGELRKFQLIKTLLASPRVLIMDNPFIGLDAKTRQQLKEVLQSLTRWHALQIILVLSKSDDIPPFITHVVETRDMNIMPKVTREEFIDSRKPLPTAILSDEKRERLRAAMRSLNNGRLTKTGTEIVNCHKVCVKYGERTILKDLDWIVKTGERWALSGQNGSGKSTLLSLICADNPQSYACDISLFGRKRGTGETIWEIKKGIGYVSPEMHRAYQKNLPAIDIVTSGLHDSVGLYVKPKPEDIDRCTEWLDMVGLKDKAQTNFLQLSSGEQRLVLIARAFVKYPDLLILDEPLHGLDNRNRRLVKDIIETYCEDHTKTLIMVTHYKEELPCCITDSLELVRN